jgi:hypothetical protein
MPLKICFNRRCTQINADVETLEERLEYRPGAIVAAGVPPIGVKGRQPEQERWALGDKGGGVGGCLEDKKSFG